MATESPEQLAVIQQQLAAHPEILQAFKTYSDWASHRGRLAYVQKGGPPNPQQVLAQYGINFPDVEDYHITPNPDGTVSMKRQNFLQRNMDWIAPLATIGGGAAIGALTSGAPAAGTVPSAGGASSGAAAGGGVGVGETAATTGLEGSGFGGGVSAGGFSAPEVGAMGNDLVGPTAEQAGFTGAKGFAGSAINKVLGKIPDAMGDLSKMTGELENGEAANRYEKGRLTQGYDRLMLDAQSDRNRNEADAMKKMAQTSYILGGGSQFNPSNVQLNSGRMPDLGFGPQPSSLAQRQGAGTLQGQLLNRLAPGGSYTPTNPDYLNRGKLETAGQAGSLISGGLGLAKDIFGLFK